MVGKNFQGQLYTTNNN